MNTEVKDYTPKEIKEQTRAKLRQFLIDLTSISDANKCMITKQEANALCKEKHVTPGILSAMKRMRLLYDKKDKLEVGFTRVSVSDAMATNIIKEYNTFMALYARENKNKTAEMTEKSEEQTTSENTNYVLIPVEILQEHGIPFTSYEDAKKHMLECTKTDNVLLQAIAMSAVKVEMITF